MNNPAEISEIIPIDSFGVLIAVAELVTLTLVSAGQSFSLPLHRCCQEDFAEAGLVLARFLIYYQNEMWCFHLLCVFHLPASVSL